ncbi:hypothetical protein KFE25_010243 [Diacronema lutheri]|uniref:Uncharacterized protein n=2 Tax=Diacronema lutheri TaxID=2081491 RepID=A0A8J5XSZ7_DIALT|nr:hypothetical protein KFE25_010243 [Diacronema lutheri]
MGAGNSTPDMPRTPNRALVVLPIKPTASSSLAVEAPTTLPQQLAGRLTAEEFNAIVGLANETLKRHGGLGLLVLLLPLLLLDLLSVALLALLNPWLLLAPWDFALGDVVLPISLEFILFFCIFPVTVYALNRKMAATQAQLRTQLDELSAAYAERGISFALRQRVGSARGCSLWLELSVAPVVTAILPVPIPVPAPYPMLVHGAHAQHPRAGAGPRAGGVERVAATGAQGGGGPPAGDAAEAPSCSPPPPSAASARAGGNAPGGDNATAAGWGVAEAMGAQLGALHSECVRLLHENGLLRAELFAWQQAALHASQQQHAVAAAAAGGQPFAWAPPHEARHAFDFETRGRPAGAAPGASPGAGAAEHGARSPLGCGSGAAASGAAASPAAQQHLHVE